MRRRMNKEKFLSLSGVTLMGVGLLAVVLAAFLVLGPDFALAKNQGKGGKKPGNGGKGKPGPELYQVTMYNTEMNGKRLDTTMDDCNVQGYILAQFGKGNILSANGELTDNTGQVQLLLGLLTDDPLTEENEAIAWERYYNVDRGFSGTFDGCYGETTYDPGRLYIYFEKHKGKTYISFVWHFDRYWDDANNIHEEFTLISDRFQFQNWDENGVSGRVTGWFDIQHYLAGRQPPYVSLTSGNGFTLDFYINIVPVSAPSP